jgi:hypothetical protein
MGNNFPSGSNEEKIYINNIVGSEYVEENNFNDGNLNLIPGEKARRTYEEAPPTSIEDKEVANKYFTFPMRYSNCKTTGEYCTQNFGRISYDSSLTYSYYNFTKYISTNLEYRYWWNNGHTEKMDVGLPISGGEFKEDVKGNLYYVIYYSGKYDIYKFTKIEEAPNLVASITTDYQFTKFIVNETSNGIRIAGIYYETDFNESYYGYCDYIAGAETNKVNWISDPIDISISDSFYLIEDDTDSSKFYIIDNGYKNGYSIVFSTSSDSITVTQILNDNRNLGFY